MRKFVGLMVVAMAVFCLAGTAWSWDLSRHVTYGTNNKGDVLIFPVNVALEGWDTKLVVINTSNEYSVVAKVIVRSPGISKELLDFLIYLSPTDVWVGYLQYGEDGAEMYSEDDSVRNNAGDFASPDAPMRVPLVDTPCDINEIVYVEVIEAWACNAVWPGGACPDDLSAPPVQKCAIKEAYEAAPFVVDDATVCSFTEMTQAVLTGLYEVEFFPVAGGADLPTFLQGYDVNTRLTIGVETRLGEGNAENNLCEVEALLSKDRIAKYYYAHDSPFVAFHWEVFPTKYTQIDPSCLIVGVLSPYFQQNMVTTEGTFEWCIEYGLRYFDLKENSPFEEFFYSPIPEAEKRFFCDEINLVVPGMSPWDFVYDEGWAEYFFDDLTSCTPESNDPGVYDQYLNFTGAPEIPVVWFIKGAGLYIYTPAWDDGQVSYYDGYCDGLLGLVPIPQYHVWEGPNLCLPMALSAD